MKPLRYLLFATIALSAFALGSRDAQAQCWGGFGFPGWYGYGTGYGYGYARYTPPPYYAVFPPVYYGKQVTMTYGDRPYFYPYDYSRYFGQHHKDAAPSSEPAASSPVMIENPFLNKQAEESAEPEQASLRTYASQPQIIENPFLDQPLAPRPGHLVKVQSLR
jgi:hypothetical protein